jgi:2-desacetyl-2-hydroxyethyl bacteriochlorophyllide A dehydrogenase
MRYASVDAAGEVSIRERRLPDPEPGEIAVRAILSGVSVGTELAVYRGTINTLTNSRWGYWTEYPIAPGYELVGYVEKRGSGVRDIREGDRVVCHAPHGTEAIVGYQDYVLVPDAVSSEAATMAMIGATTAHGFRKAQMVYGERVLILGLGVVGFLSGEHARRGGAWEVLPADPLPWKRGIAGERGFDAVLDPLAATFEEELLELTGGRGVDLVIEASGHPSAIPPALLSVRRGGRILLQGTQTESVSMRFSDYPMHKEVTLISTWGKGPARTTDPEGGVWSRKANQQLAMELIARGELRVGDLVTHRFPFDDIARVYSSLDNGELNYLQVLLTY